MATTCAANGLFSLTVVLRFIGTERTGPGGRKWLMTFNKTLWEIRQEIKRMRI